MAQYEEFTIDQGTDVAIEIHLTSLDGSAKNLTNHFVNAKLKKTYASDSSDTVAFATVISAPATAGIITLGLSNTQTDYLKAGRYVYDVELSFYDSAQNTVIERILEGKCFVTPSVTR